MILNLKPKFSKRVRALIRKYRFAGILRFGDTVASLYWHPGRQVYTDKFVRRLFTIGAVSEEPA
jgi:hypothetical protein